MVDFDSAVTPPRFTAPTNDPWRGLRGVMAGTLILEVIVIILAFPVVAVVGGGLTVPAIVYLSVLTAALIVASGMQRRSWAMRLNLGLQVVAVAGFWLHWAIGTVGVLFFLVWLYIAYIKRDVQRRLDAGLLFGQEPLS